MPVKLSPLCMIILAFSIAIASVRENKSKKANAANKKAVVVCRLIICVSLDVRVSSDLCALLFHIHEQRTCRIKKNGANVGNAVETEIYRRELLKQIVRVLIGYWQSINMISTIS